jgi:hypothetical protein
MFNIPTQRLAKVTVTEPTTDVTLSVNPIVIAALSFTPRHLVVRVNGRLDGAFTWGSTEIQFNGDTGTNYSTQRLEGAGTNATATRANGVTSLYSIIMPGDSAAANTFGGGEVLIPDALSTRTHKSSIALSGAHELNVRTVAGRWASTAAITSVTIGAFTDDFMAGSTFELCVVDESFNIDEQIKTGDGTFTVSSIAAADGDLVVIGNLRSDRSGAGDAVVHNINDDGTSGNYAGQALYGDNTSAGAFTSTLNIANITGNTATTSAFGVMVGQFSNFADGANDPAYNFLAGYHAASNNASVYLYSTRRNNVEAITKLEFSPESSTNFITGSMLSTYAVPKNLITRTELASAASSVTFSSIPQTYDHLELTVYTQNDRGGGATVDQCLISINSDSTSANYDRQRLSGSDGSSVSAQTSAAQREIMRTPATAAGANVFGGGTATFYNYTKTDRHKHLLAAAGLAEPTYGGIMDVMSMRWENTAAITSITLANETATNFIAGSVFTLRGINSTAPATASDVAALNGIAPADIEAVN